MYNNGMWFFVKTQLIIIFIFNIIYLIIYFLAYGLITLILFTLPIYPKDINLALNPFVLASIVYFILGSLYSKTEKPDNLFFRYFPFAFSIFYVTIACLIIYLNNNDFNQNTIFYFYPYNITLSLYSMIASPYFTNVFNSTLTLYLHQIDSLVFLLLGFIVGEKWLFKHKHN